MAYRFDDLTGTQPTVLIAEHRSLVQWLQHHPREGHVEYLHSRLVDVEAGLALYYVQGLGMSDGKSFALVREQDIFVFDAWSDLRATPVPFASISRVSIPEKALLSQAAIQSLIASGFSSYARLQGFSGLFPHDCVADFKDARWEVRQRGA
ncbi:hypothetical protein ACS5PN_07380 [Roseateles sp. NT4]|uniref:hypothetical protein n=1 Tax=Roseateles sp. NT4 TaxID=3453715 RepID=UPI003EEE63A2